MFTGIIQRVGTIAALEQREGDLRLNIDAGAAFLASVAAGDSIAVSGCCLTVVRLDAGCFTADASRETLALTTLGELRTGVRVNLERALTLATALGGHLVSGHVDGVGEVVARDDDARSRRLRVRAPTELARYLVRKGSITVDGVSLTVNAVEGAEFEFNAVPHTLANTLLDDYRLGSRVNLEVDLLARYLERLLEARATPLPAATSGTLTRAAAKRAR